MINKELKDYIDNSIIVRYKDYEASHNDSHILTVINNSFDIVKDMNLDVDENMVYTIAAYHDLGIPMGRKTHHLSSAQLLLEDNNLRQFFNDEELLIMKEAIEDHRASSPNPPKSIYGRIVAEADRDIDPYRVLERCIQYQKNKYPTSTDEEIFIHAKEHIIEKYGDNGYLNIWLNTKRNKEGLDTIRNWIRTNEIDNLLKSYI